MEWSEKLIAARKNCTPVDPIMNEKPDLSMDEGYAIQTAMLESELASGRELSGYKMGLTSRAKQMEYGGGKNEPIRGFLMKDMEFSGTLTRSEWIHPRAEPEVALRFRSGIEGEPTRESVLAAVEHLSLAIEILDSRFKNFKFNLPDVVADNSSSAAYLLGKNNCLETENLPFQGVVLKKNGLIVHTGCPAAVMGDPILSAVALETMLRREGKKIEPGMIVLTGAVSASVPLEPGDRIEAEWPGETLSFEVK